jgi:Ca2+-binding RTX toxin-like protein
MPSTRSGGTAEIIVGLFLVVHGLVHLMYLGPRPEDDPNYPSAPIIRMVCLCERGLRCRHLDGSLDSERAFLGESERDHATGGGGPDILKGFGGNDRLFGGLVNDQLAGGRARAGSGERTRRESLPPRVRAGS